MQKASLNGSSGAFLLPSEDGLGGMARKGHGSLPFASLTMRSPGLVQLLYEKQV